MVLETTLIAGVFGAIIPTLFLGIQHYNKKKMELVYNIRVAQALGHASAIRDYETGAHNFRVAYMASIIGEELAMNKLALQGLMKGAFLHDVGKIGIPDKILLKNAPLDEDEWRIMKQHPMLGEELLKQMPWFSDAIDVILYHHERFDGSGYPKKLKGYNIPKNARIFAIIDVFDALLATRPYKRAFSFEETIKIMKEYNNTHFDPLILKKFLVYAPDFANIIATNSYDELKLKLEQRRKKIFGV